MPGGVGDATKLIKCKKCVEQLKYRKVCVPTARNTILRILAVSHATAIATKDDDDDGYYYYSDNNDHHHHYNYYYYGYYGYYCYYGYYGYYGYNGYYSD